MSNTTIRARPLPYREPRPGTYACGRCGITRTKNDGRSGKYCFDCLPEVRALGWATRQVRKVA